VIDPSEILFVGIGASAVCYYRVLLPATALGADYIGLNGDPPQVSYATGLVRGQSQVPRFSDYKVVVLQQPKGAGWLKVIDELQSHGVTVIYEVDDWLHAIEAQQDHDFRDAFKHDQMAAYEACMRSCDGMIVSTDFLASCYRPFNRNVWVCRNGIDPARYAYTRPERETVNIGWAGATGHRDAAVPWLQAAAQVMSRRPSSCFVSIGQPFAEGFVPHFGAERALSIPWCAIEQYPAAMTMFDIALAPAGKSGFYKAKSDLRWLEASALGIPVIGHPYVYRDIEDGVTGFRAMKPEKVQSLLLDLIDSPELRTVVGEQARAHVLSQRTYTAMSPLWADAIERAVKVSRKRATV